MIGRQTLVSLWVWLLLIVALCPGAHYTHGKRGFSFRGGKKGDDSSSSKESAPSQRGGFAKHSLKWAGAAAAAGMLGGTGTGYGLGFLGRPKHSSKGHYGHREASAHREQHYYYTEGQGSHNRSQWKANVKAAAAAPVSSVLLTLGSVVSLVIALWMRVV